jgi:hypothetical protein
MLGYSPFFSLPYLASANGVAETNARRLGRWNAEAAERGRGASGELARRERGLGDARHGLERGGDGGHLECARGGRVFDRGVG